MSGNGRFPRIVPTPGGYDLACAIADSLEERYLGDRFDPSTDPSLVVPVKITSFGDTTSKAELEGEEGHVRGQDIYVIGDVRSHTVRVPEPSIEAESWVTRMGRGYHETRVRKIPVETRLIREPVGTQWYHIKSVVSAARNALDSDGKLTLVLPFHPDSRQEDLEGRESKDLQEKAIQIESWGVDRVVTMDMHNPGAAHCSYRYPTAFDNLRAAYTFIKHLRDNPIIKGKRVVYVAPDVGKNAIRLGQLFERELGGEFGIIVKQRDYDSPGELHQDRGYLGPDLKGATVILPDDIIDSGRTNRNATLHVRDLGAAEVYNLASHMVASGRCISRFDKLYEEGMTNGVLVTDSITLSDEIWARPWMHKVSTVNYLAKSINHLNLHNSLSKLLSETTVQ